jgi:hypothetical protein
MEYLNDTKNKITQKIIVGNTTTTVKWLPLYFRQTRSATADSKDSLNSANDDFYYFNVKFERVATEKFSKEKTMYLDFDMQKDFALLVKNDSISPAICQKIENGLSGSYEYMLAFEKNQKNNPGDFSLVYNDKIFGNGNIVFVYNQSDIQKIPTPKSLDSK